MDRLSFEIEADGFEPLGVDDMGEGVIVLSQPNERGKVERVAVSREQLLRALDETAARFGRAKNIEPLPVAA